MTIDQRTLSSFTSFALDRRVRTWVGLLLVFSGVPVARAQDVAAVAVASLTDPAKLATLTSGRAANPRLKKAVYWLAEARGRGRTAADVIAEHSG
jgi:hypothetical protein